MDPNNNSFNNQNSSNFPFNFQNHNNYQFQNQTSNHPQNIPNYGFSPNFFMLSSVPNYPPNYGSMMQYFYQTPPLSSTPTGDENVLRATEFPEKYVCALRVLMYFILCALYHVCLKFLNNNCLYRMYLKFLILVVLIIISFIFLKIKFGKYLT